ncbi:MAG: hypothetical protein ACLGIC_12965 [Acidimicrobiia bacterium]
MKRLLRLTSLAAGVAAVVAMVKALRRDHDPLPAPASTPSEPWPPLRPEDAASASDATPDPVPTPDASPAPNPPDASGEVADDVVRAPEPDGIPVAASPVAGTSWTEPTDDGECPEGYPIKAKMSSKIFHAPGQLNYDRTTPDRCYVDAAAAEADGLRAAKR